MRVPGLGHDGLAGARLQPLDPLHPLWMRRASRRAGLLPAGGEPGEGQRGAQMKAQRLGLGMLRWAPETRHAIAAERQEHVAVGRNTGGRLHAVGRVATRLRSGMGRQGASRRLKPPSRRMQG